MSKITKEQYEFALARIEELLPMVDDNTPANDRNAIELTMMSDVVIDYEKEHFPIATPTDATEAERTKAVIGADIRGNVYGGGNAANVSGNTNVKIGR